MKLIKYCVTNFRSVKDSGWIDCDDVVECINLGIGVVECVYVFLGLCKSLVDIAVNFA